MSTLQYLCIAQLSTAVLMWALQGSVLHQMNELSHLSMKGFAAAMFVSIVACVLCYAVLYWLLNHIEGHRLALFDGFHTLSATIFGYILFQEPLRPLMIFGGLLILIGLIVGNWPKQLMEEIPE